AEAQRVHDGNWPRPHGENVAQNAANAGGGAVKWLNERGMVMRFDLEGARPAIPDIDNGRIFAGSLQNDLAPGRQALEVDARGFIGAMFAPHHAEDAKLGARWFASAQQLFDLFEFVRSKAVLPDHLRCNGWNRRSRHDGET